MFAKLVQIVCLVSLAPSCVPLSGDEATEIDYALVVDSSTLDHKLITGYQGWFRCPGDGSPLEGWRHWFSGTAAQLQAERFNLATPGERDPGLARVARYIF